jgi:hypothetical protein
MPIEPERPLAVSGSNAVRKFQAFRVQKKRHGSEAVNRRIEQENHNVADLRGQTRLGAEVVIAVGLALTDDDRPVQISSVTFGDDCAADAPTKPRGLPAQPCEPSGTGQADFALSCLRSPT